MTSISSVTSQPMSPRDRIQQELEDEVGAGTISEGDSSAMSDALDAIDEAMKSDASSGTKLSPDDMQSKIESLIDDQVEAGTLTDDQASALKEAFQNAAPDGAGAPPPPSGEAGASGSDTSDLLSDFVKSLQSSTATATGYSIDGSTTSSSAGSLVLDTTA